MNPVFGSGSNHRYDVTDYEAIEPADEPFGYLMVHFVQTEEEGGSPLTHRTRRPCP